jgi:hypothetical protein
MTLAELAFASFVFSRFGGGAYERLWEEVNGCVDLSILDHQLATIRWLSAWGIRAIPKTYHNSSSVMSKQMGLWYRNNELFDHNQNLHELTDADFVLVGNAYEDLLNVKCVGPTAAAKILFVVRPKALMMWDNAIRTELQHSGTSQSYICFLRWAQARILEIRELCEEHAFELRDLSNRLGRPNSTIPKLLDEYLWITITKGLMPNKADFQRWVEWC